MTELQALWLELLQQVTERSAHEVKDALNGVALNVEVVRSRSLAEGVHGPAIVPFAAAAAGQMEVLTRRIESFLFLARPPREPTDVASTLRHLAELLVPAAAANRGSLTVRGAHGHAPTAASGTAVRLALGAGLLAVCAPGRSGSCHLETGSETVVRFSHESAGAVSLDPATLAALAGQSIRIDRSGTDLILVFPGTI